MSSYRIRFKFNQQTGGRASFGRGGTHGGFENFARAIVERVAFVYGENMYELVKTHIQSRMKGDIERELDHMAQLLMMHVIGISGRNRGPTGQLSTVAPVSDAMKDIPNLEGTYIRNLTKTWDRREPSYMQSRKWAGDSWFQRTGSVLAPLGSAKTWTRAFGGIVVSVGGAEHMASEQAGNLKFVQTGYGGKAQVAVATIRVKAMDRISPAMLPALGGGGLGDFGGSPRTSGLLSLLGERVANRLGGNPQNVPFRPTIQPFLGYFLTRAMPNAVFKRIEQGFEQQRWKWTDVGGAGRNG